MSASTAYAHVAVPVAGRARDTAFFIARIGLGAIFVQSGFGKLAGLAAFAAGLEKMGVPAASLVAPVAAGVEFFGGMAVVLGAWTWIASALVAGFTLLATLLAHRYWTYPAAQQPLQQVQFMKNVAIIGGFIALMAAGPGRFSIDYWLRGRSR